MENYVALKVIKSAQHYTETAADEIRLLEAIRMNETKHPYCEKIVKLLNHFTIRGVNGVHTCLVFEALGCSLYKLIVKNNFQGLPKRLVKSIIKQVSFHTLSIIRETDLPISLNSVCEFESITDSART